MGIGASIFLIVVGAILAFAVDVRLGGIDINAIGWILLLAGALGPIMTALIRGRRRTVVAPAPVAVREVVPRGAGRLPARAAPPRRRSAALSDPESVRVTTRWVTRTTRAFVGGRLRNIVAAPSMDDVADGLASLDHDRHSEMTLVDGSGAYITAGGGRGRYLVYVAAYDHDDCVVLQDPDAGDGDEDLVVDGRLDRYAVRDVVGLDAGDVRVRLVPAPAEVIVATELDRCGSAT